MQWEKRCIGRSATEYLKEFLPDLSSEEVEKILRAKDSAYAGHLTSYAAPLWKPGVRGLLQWLRSSGVSRALATSTSRANFAILDRALDLQSTAEFSFTICGDEVARAKPDPSIYLAVRHFLGPAERYLVLEDSVAGLRSARAAQMSCVVVPSSFSYEKLDFLGAVMVIDSLCPEASVLWESIEGGA
jgi:HAD superfamily hydrolase (TIGR01509 family)